MIAITHSSGAVPKSAKVAMYGGTLYTLKPGEKEGQFGDVFLYKAHVQLSIAQGALLDDPYGLLDGGGYFRRHRMNKSLNDVEVRVSQRFGKAAIRL